MLFLKLMLLSVILMGNRLIHADLVWEPPVPVEIDENGVLQSINTPEIPSELNLGGLDISDINETVIENLTSVRSLNLADNRISNLRESVFSKLINLESLFLSNNSLTGTKNAFIGLGNLTYLDISNNPLREVLDDNCFLGLTKSCSILIKGSNGVKKIGSNAFGNESLTTDSTNDDAETELSYYEKKIQEAMEKLGPFAKQLFPNNSTSDGKQRKLSTLEKMALEVIEQHLPRKPRSRNDKRASICMTNSTVQSVEYLGPDAGIPDGCKEARIGPYNLYLTGMGIASFEKGWNRVNRNGTGLTFTAVKLSSNDISQVGQEVVNDLPEYITWVDLDGNKIQHLGRGSFVHPRIFSLELSNNLIEDIDHYAFKMPELHQLFLGENRLKDTRFAATLPSGLISLYLQGNEITDVYPNSFCHLNSLSYLNLKGNKLTAIRAHFFRGAIRLNQLLLMNNNIDTIEAGAFENVGVGQLALENNNITRLEKGTFRGLDRLFQLDLSGNKLTKIGRDDFEQPNIRILQLGGNNITEIEKGAMRKLKKLERLELWNNPIRKLENGALFGLNKSGSAYVAVEGTPIEVIEGGVFDNV